MDAVVSLENGTLLGSYEIIAPIGAGGMGEVYRARDHKLDRDVAIKVLPEDLADDRGRRERFEREARAASALNHPNIITIHDIGSHGSSRYMVMELVTGKTLRALFDEGPVPPRMLVRLARQLAEGLAKANAAGIVHRDLKPENAMVTEDGYVKILDFGLAKLTRIDLSEGASESATLVKQGTLPGTVLGTVGYMSPEQARGEEADHRSDQFSLGAILYEMATGQRAFHRETAVQTLSAILESQPKEMMRLGGMLSEPFRVVVERCLSKESAARYDTTAELGQALKRIEENFVSRPELAEPPAIETAAKHATVGRASTLAELHQGLEKAMSGAGVLLCVAGEAGIGKTTVTETFLSSLSENEARVARGRCSERLAGTEAYLPVLEVLESLMRDRVIAETLKRRAPSWHSQVAHLTPEPGQAASQQERLKREVAGFIQEITHERPLVVFLDDLHWADVSTVDLLGYLAMRFDTMRLLVVVTYRKEEMRAAQHPFLDLQLELQSRGACREIALGFLSREDLARYLELEFPGHGFPKSFPELLHAKTEGSPLFLVDLLRYLQEREVIEEQDGVYRLARSPEDVDTDLPQSIQGMIQRKVERLEDEARQLLELGSVQGFEFDSAVLSKVSARDAEDVEESLQKLERVNAFVERVREEELPDATLSLRYRFVHVLYQNALYDSLSPSRRVSWSRQVAEALESFYGPKRREVASELAFLYRAARERSKAAAYSHQAAENAARVSANHEAVSLAQQGLALLESLPHTRERDESELALRVILAPTLTAIRGWQHPDVESTWTRAGELAEHIGDLEKLFAVHWGLCAYEYVRGDNFVEVLELQRKLLSMAERLDDDGLELAARWTVGATLHERGEIQQAREELERGLVLHDPERHRHLAWRFADEPGVGIRTYLSQILLMSGFPDAAMQMQITALELAQRLAHPSTMCRVLFFGATVRFQMGDLLGMQTAIQGVVSLSEEHDLNPLFLSFANVFSGHALTQSGKHDEGEALIRSGVEDWEKVGANLLLQYRLFVLADALKLAGKHEDGLVAVDEALSYMRRSKARLYESELHRLQGELLLLDEKPEIEAEAAYRRAIDIAQRQDAKLFELRAAVGLARLLRNQSRGREALEILAPTYAWFTEGLDTRDLKKAKALLDELS